jgi:hypothetical protein
LHDGGSIAVQRFVSLPASPSASMRSTPNMENSRMDTSRNQPEFDVIVVGGSYAGLSAALQLARARRSVLVIDAGRRRNRFALHSHGFLTQDGSEAAAIAMQGRAQLQAYPNVMWRGDTAGSASGAGEHFEVTLSGGGHVKGRRLVLAMGVSDGLPAIDVLATGELSMHHALLLPDWGRVTLFLNGAFTPNDAQGAAHADGGTVRRAAHHDRRRSCAAARVRAGSRPDGRLRGDRRDESDQCAGRVLLRPAGNVALAVADGAMAGAAAHRSLIPELNHAM